MTYWRYTCLISLLLLSAGTPGKGAPEQQLILAERGAGIFMGRCAICHGNDARGNGLVPLTVGNYPSTDLLKARYGKSEDALKAAILWGGSKGDMSPLSPPWADELTWQEITAILSFTRLLHSDSQQALALLRKETEKLPASKKLGQQVYHTRCTLCHGRYGDGKGKMAKIITSPPPYNLRKSNRSASYLQRIIALGGQAMNRSHQMPPWQEELSGSEIKSVVIYIKTLRELTPNSVAAKETE